MRTIDADAHVIETLSTFEFMDEAERKFAPIVVTQTAGQERQKTFGGVFREYWMIDNITIPKDKLVDVATPDEARDMSSIDSRLKHMDKLEIDVQVLYPTMFLTPVAKRPEATVSLTRSYNRWLAQIWQRAGGRLRWVVIPPLYAMDKVYDELAWAKDNGACGIFMNGMECDRLLTDPYFYPLYKTAEELDLAICVHAGINSPTAHNLFINSTFMLFKLSVINAFHNLIMENIPAMFPKIRWGFVEVSAQWIPYLANDLALRFRKRGKQFPEDFMKAFNMYVACQVTDDLSAILPVSGEDNLVIGTDYGHSDTSSEIEALRLMRGNRKVPDRVIDKILGDNPKALYGLK